jgi:acyl carrier protein
MVPVSITRLERLPRTSSGKIDRAALPKPDFGPHDPARTAPRSDIEHIISELWCEVLGLEQLGVHDNFFALGGHSLHATQLISRLNAAFEVDISFREFFATPTVAGLAPTVELAVLRDIAVLSAVEPEAAFAPAAPAGKPSPNQAPRTPILAGPRAGTS